MVRVGAAFRRPKGRSFAVSYTQIVRSGSAGAIVRARLERLAAMTADERVAMAARLGEEALAMYMSAHSVDRRTAVARIKATRHLGRRRSACAETDAR